MTANSLSVLQLLRSEPLSRQIPPPIALIPRSPADTVPRASPSAKTDLTMDSLPPHMRPERSFQGFGPSARKVVAG